MDKLRKQESVFYIVAWAVVFASVPLSALWYVAVGRDTSVTWQDVYDPWLRILPFLLLFLAHDLGAVPMLFRKKHLAYALMTAALLAVFGFYCYTYIVRPPADMPAGMPLGMPLPPVSAPPDGRRPLTPELMRFGIGLLVIIANIGVKAFFHGRRTELRLEQARKENLERQLEALRYQVNPHFFMNTLNNIHALVDIDPEKAKESIEEFSKIMRLVLYEGDSPTISLFRETECLENFVSLMRIRYPESVEITLDFPESDQGAEVPPLVMASFVENAFKHGISYESPSYVRVSVVLEGNKVVFRCSNSRHGSPAPAHHGLGLENVRRRLDLMYGNNYTLVIEEKAEQYDVLMVIPAKEAEA